MKRFLPAPLKLQLKRSLRLMHDWRSGSLKKFAKARPQHTELPYQLELDLRLNPNPAKLKNLQIAIAAIEQVEVWPQEIFSFWQAVPAPYRRNGYLESRSIIDGVLQSSVGGGLCQLSGMLYYMSLKADLKIVERHPHSRDIYTEAERYTPLGSDATVVYGYKDLRIQNPLDQVLQFSFQIKTDRLLLLLRSNLPLTEHELEFRRKDISTKQSKVCTFVDGDLRQKTLYRKA